MLKLLFALALVACGPEPARETMPLAPRDSDAGPAAIRHARQDGAKSPQTCDRDGDRVSDYCDLCPDDPETYNGMADRDGCPDRGRDDFSHPAHSYGSFAVRGINADASLDVEPGRLDAYFKALDLDIREGVVGRMTILTRAERDGQVAQKRANTIRALLVMHGLAAEQVEIRVLPKPRWPREYSEARAVIFVVEYRNQPLYHWTGTDFELRHEHPENLDAPPPDPRCWEARWVAPCPEGEIETPSE